MSLVASTEGPPEPKRFRSSLPTQVVVERPTFTYQSSSSPLDDAANGGQSPAGPSSARSSSASVKEEREDTYVSTNGTSASSISSNNNLLYQRTGQSLVDAISTAMMFQASSACRQTQSTSQRGRGKSATPNVPAGPPIPGAIAAASSPAAALFGENDWSWHRNPAAAIRSGGTNKQTPVWKYFVYNKAENLSRCIVGTCTYVLRGPHTSTLACHLKKHPIEYTEFQKLKLDYTRERASSINSNNLARKSASPASTPSGSGNAAQLNGTNQNRSRVTGNSNGGGTSSVIRNRIHDACSSGNAVLSSGRHQTPTGHTSATAGSGRQSNHSVSNILDVLNARASVAALASGNGHLLQNPMAAMFTNSQPDNIINNNSPTGIISIQNPVADSNSPASRNNGGVFADMFAANLLLHASTSAAAAASSTPTVSVAPVVAPAPSSSSRKWGREDRKQKEMEIKLALMISASQLPVNIIENSFFREFMEYVQPRFTLPHDVNYIEELINTQRARMVLNLKNQLAVAKKVAIMIDVLKLNTPTTSAAAAAAVLSTGTDEKEEAKDLESKDSTSVNSDSGFEISDENQSGTDSPKSSAPAMQIDEMRPLVRLCISVAFYSPLAQRMEVALLGVRPLADQLSILDAVKVTVEQILMDFDITTNKVSRYLCNGICELVENDVSADEIFPRMLEPYNQKLTQSLLNVIDANKGIEELKKSFYSMILNFVTRPNAMELLQQTVGRQVSLPIADSFLVLTDAVLEIKDAFLDVCAQISPENPVEPITESQWQVLENVSRLLRLFRTHMNVVQDGVYATIDGVVPSLMQLQVSLDKDFTILGDLATQLKLDLQKRTASVLDTSVPDFDGIFIQATALNPQLAVLLDDEQLAYARNAIEQQLNERMRMAEELVARRTARLNGGVDALLATVVDRAAAVAAASTSNTSGFAGSNGTDLDKSPCTAASTSLYPDLVHAANERRKIMKERHQAAVKNRYAEAIVQSYFDELAAGTNQTPSSPLAGAFPAVALNDRDLAPLQYWQLNSAKYGLLSEIATELLTVPSSTVSLERIFAISSPDTPSSGAAGGSAAADTDGYYGGCTGRVSFDPMALIKTLDDPLRMERDAMLRFNRALIPRF